MKSKDRQQDSRIEMCERLLYALVILQFPQLMTLI